MKNPAASGAGEEKEEEEGEEEEEEQYFSFSRNYFLAKELKSGSSSRSAKNLRKKLSDIDVVDEQDLRKAASEIGHKHEKETILLLNSYRRLYRQWSFELRCGFGLLMHGFGSKKALLEDFATKSLTEYGVIVVNGYLPTINIKHVVVNMAEILCKQMKTFKKARTQKEPKNACSFEKQSMEELLEFLNERHDYQDDCILCLVIHNIDGPGLRDCESQQCLARIASCSRIRVVASIDHVNSLLLWDKKMVNTEFNWSWYHVPTFVPYKAESTFVPMIFENTGAVQNARTGAIVLSSLTPNAQSIFRILAEHQLGHPEEEGLALNALYAKCRDQFLVISQVTLHSHLTEFKDHELVRVRKSGDGQDCLHIPLQTDVLQKLLEEIA